MDLIYRYDPFQPVQHEEPATADEALAVLGEGNARFAEFVGLMQRATLGEKVQSPIVVPVSPLSLGLPLWSGGAPAQAPFALVLGCSDARAPIEAIFDQAFNDLFAIRIAGNVLGTECLGSVDYAVRNFGPSLKLVVVLGHSGCGAVTAAVDTYLSPHDYAEIACTHALRSLVDRIQIAVRSSAKALERVAGAGAASRPGFRAAILETAVYLNAAVTAFDLRREIRDLGRADLPVVYGVYDLGTLRVQSVPAAVPASAGRPRGTPQPPASDAPLLGAAPEHAEDFTELSNRLAQAVVAAGLLG